MKFQATVQQAISKIKQVLRHRFLASPDDEPGKVRSKHIRLGVVLFVMLIGVCILFLETTPTRSVDKVRDREISNHPLSTEGASAFESLASGLDHEKRWTELAGKDVEELKATQKVISEKHQKFEERIAKDSVSKEELAALMLSMKTELEASYHEKLAREVALIRQEHEQKPQPQLIESKRAFPRKKYRTIGDYIPANSYVQAKLVSGVDAGVGMSSEANPRQALLRITGETVSAGIGAEFLKTNRLIGCLLSAKAVGDISSEKAYLDGVLLTCAVDKRTAVEVPVKAYVTSNAKSGIRGEVVSREGDLVLKSFLSGLASGFGSGVRQFNQPSLSLAGGGILATEKQKGQEILKGGLGSGLSTSGDMLSQYFIKRAEQYQPVISINEGIEVYVVFQEGFSLREESDERHS